MPRRTDRVNELLRQEISSLLALQIKDPRLRGVISITRVATTADLRSAHVFLSVIGDLEAKRNALAGIRSAASFIRHELRPRLTLRNVPFLTFDLDEAAEESLHVLGLMDNLLDGQPNIVPLPDSTIRSTNKDDEYTGPLSFPKSGN